ncbi:MULTISPECIES: hypothetical protein [Burkholderia]|jgi:hypothetical protein|uniref:hypothetical protein n=1 Tax=Burkholderia TaxID=32008 RepID=UPI0008416A36|nr:MULTISPECIES: hypothetical protein [Burkholderia]AOJ99909.1 hypothetical protein WK23_15430 [Burkholderia vietnamiensis]MBM6427872.1 hypothetical protein [Burkholderia contaminans]MCA7984878.1 hypothetical protein [Burkholderia vietnamiensis]MDN8066310.1 hypothetical protein [Burkholderia vietnamiensis]
MSVKILSWAIRVPVNEPIQKLVLLALADGVAPDSLKIALHYNQAEPGWDFGDALNWLFMEGLIKVEDERLYFFLGSRDGWEDRSGHTL